METLFSLFDSIYPISEAARTYLWEAVKSKKVAKKEFLLRTGQTCKNVYFVEKGLFRAFYQAGEHEICSWFMKESDVIISVSSFFTQQPGHETIQALEQAWVHYLSFAQWQYAYHTFLELNLIRSALLEKYYRLSEERLHAIKMRSAEEKYRFLMTRYPEIIQRVPSMYIASYLGISFETLSRIKSRK